MFLKNTMRLNRSDVSFKFVYIKCLRDRNYVKTSLIVHHCLSIHPLYQKSGMFFYILFTRGDSYTTNMLDLPENCLPKKDRKFH